MTIIHCHAYLSAQVINDGLILAVVSHVGPPLLQSLHDLHLQLLVGPFQVPHRLQVVGQTVVQVLHGSLLVAQDPSTTTTTSRHGCSHTATHSTAQLEGRGRRGDWGTGPQGR